MKKSRFLYVANWKMQKPYEQVKRYFLDHGTALARLIHEKSAEIVIAPSFVSVPYCIAQMGGDGAIAAQDCSAYPSGAYTGQVDATSLSQMGCRFVIVGHSERRAAGDTDEGVAQKACRVIEAGMIPIICIGESESEYRAQKSIAALNRQWEPIAMAVSQYKVMLCIAYEPVWSIGTGVVADPAYLQGIFKHIISFVKHLPESVQVRLIYGGSVNESNVVQLRLLDAIEGFLIGSASLDFQKFENIVSLYERR